MRTIVFAPRQSTLRGEDRHTLNFGKTIAAALDVGAAPLLAAGRIADDSDTAEFAATTALIDLAGSTTAAITSPAHWLREAGASLAQQAPSPFPDAVPRRGRQQKNRHESTRR